MKEECGRRGEVRKLSSFKKGTMALRGPSSLAIPCPCEPLSASANKLSDAGIRNSKP
jgi:hypothetical protein